MSTAAQAVSADAKLCRKKFTHPGHAEAFLREENRGRSDMEDIKPLKGKEFVCDKRVDASGKHVDGSVQCRARIKGSGTSEDRALGGESVEEIGWEA
jgi:hypothetical protein